MIPLDDRGLLLGDGLFETLLARDGVLIDGEAHLDRLAAGCVMLGLPSLDRALAARRMSEALSSITAPRVAVRLTLTAGSGGRGLDRPATPGVRLFATAVIATAPDGPARLSLSQVRRNEGSPSSRLKSLAYLDNLLARASAQAAGVEEALMLNNREEVACASAANVFWVREGRLFTPTLECGVLSGIMRARVIAAAGGIGVEVHQVAAPVDDLLAADAAFLTNSLIGVRAVESLEARVYGASPLVSQLARAVA